MRFLITAGPTREAIDPVRYLSNRSSGKMGYAIAEAAIGKGHEVVLISGPVSVPEPEGVEAVFCESAEVMFQAVRTRITECDAAVMCAAVADFRPKAASSEKIKKDRGSLILELEPTEDILGSARTAFGFDGCLVGFAAETENLDENARAKLDGKGCDLLVANDVSRTDIGFDSDENEVCLYFNDGRRKSLPRQTKTDLGKKLVEIVEELVKGGAP